MTAPRYSLFHRLMHHISSSRSGAWFFARTLPMQDRLVLKLSGGRWTVTGLLAGLPVVWVTSTGAKSGRPRTSPLLAIRSDRADADFAVIGTNFGQQHHPAWYYNLKANPRATCTLQGHTGSYAVHEASGAEYERYWQRAEAVYRGYPLYKQRVRQRDIPMFVMTPQAG